MPESFSFADGALYAWTGAAQPPNALAFVQNVSITVSRDWQGIQTINGGYLSHVIGRRADVNFDVVHHATAPSVWELFNLDSAIHLHIQHTYMGVSAGMYLWSGHSPVYYERGSEGSPMLRGLAYYSHTWSGYG